MAKVTVDRGAGRAVRNAKLPDWMVAMALAVGAKRRPREAVGDVLDRLAGDALAKEYAEVTAGTKCARLKGAK